MSPTSDFKIAIIGAGPAGLTLASLLTASTHPFNFTIFELRGRPDPSGVNVPSGNLDLQEGFGLEAIKACGLYPRFLEIKSGCTEQTKILDKNGTVFFDDVGEGRPEISRNALAQLLLSSVPGDRIRWNTKVLTVTPANGSEKGTVEFKENTATASTSETYDLIVGADGAWSRARAAIPSAPQPIYSGACSVTLYLPSLTENYPDLDEMIGGGTFAVLDNSKVILSQRGIRGTARLCFFLHSKCQAAVYKELQSSAHDDRVGPNPILDADRLLSVLPTNYKDLQEFLFTDQGFFASWSEDTKRLLTVAFEDQPADAKVDARPLYMLPLTPYPHPHTKEIALVGDAAHLMTPFAGKGVNVAMADSLSLAEQLERLVAAPSSAATFKDDLDEALVAFEEAVHPRAKEAMNLTWLNLLLSYGENAPELFSKVMAS